MRWQLTKAAPAASDSVDEAIRRHLILTRLQNIVACEADLIVISSVTAWEIALLVDTGRIELDIPVDAWIDRFLDRPGLEDVPLAHRVAARSYQLYHLEHRDPADRLLIATATDLRCPLVTYDERITQFGKKRGRQQEFSIEI